ncbi:hypothetical protein [Helicobacter sp. 11S02596-1]|uniref:hypothetical protein n=1 Tax=Helicobacter sp. 11S02596-1 TaxID=1476194 RepID=UPI000BA5A2A7|nr:hypothetical protein [Helicobacter sp. 11S02596-1]PAF45043.1 hypothetical protein BJI48_00265 [Helicobacter sp. 11S02596-1]
MILKIAISIALFLSLAFADALDDKIENLIGTQAYNVNKNFINRIFNNKQAFYVDGRIDIKKLVATLKDNGLLILKFSQPSELNITFVSQTTPIFLTRSINSALSSMGYSYFAVSKAEYTAGIAKITFSFATEHALEPSIMIDELNKRGYIFTDIKRNSIFDWEYDIELVDPKLANAREISPSNEVLEVREVSGEYWFSTKDSGNITITAKTPYWRPRIVLYDKDLQIINLISQTSTTKKITFSLLEGIRFIMVSDIQNPAIIKNGLEIKFEEFDK